LKKIPFSTVEKPSFHKWVFAQSRDINRFRNFHGIDQPVFIPDVASEKGEESWGYYSPLRMMNNGKQKAASDEAAL
jgi:hypothetical protein